MQEEGIILIRETLEAVKKVVASVDELKDDFGRYKLSTNERFIRIENKIENKFDKFKTIFITLTILAPIFVFLVNINFIKIGF